MRVLFLLLILACSGCTSPRVASGEAEVRVQSFNLRLAVASDGNDAWPNRIDAVIALMQGVDLIGVQEALPGMLADVDARLPGYARIGAGRDASGGDEYSAIYYRRDRFDLVASGTFWLSPTPAIPGSQGWDAALPRIATWGRFRDRASGAVFVHANTHFDHVGETARRESARLIVARLNEFARDLPIVLTGDFNVTPEAEPYRVLAAAYRDARDVTETPPTGVAATWNGFGRDALTRRIDFLFVASGVRVRSFATLDGTIGDVLGTENPRYPSDHFPIEAAVVIPAR